MHDDERDGLVEQAPQRAPSLASDVVSRCLSSLVHSRFDSRSIAAAASSHSRRYLSYRLAVTNLGVSGDDPTEL